MLSDQSGTPLGGGNVLGSGRITVDTTPWRVAVDAIDILGSVLGHQVNRGGRGADILKDILRGGSRSREQPPSAPPSQTEKPSAHDIHRQAKQLEELLGVANERNSRTNSRPVPPTDPASADANPRDADANEVGRSPSELPRGSDAVNEQALVLVRAMMNAAKADGRIDRQEQQNILARLDDRSGDAVAMLRAEWKQPLDVRDFAWSVPIGMEQQVYTMSLIAIDLDVQREFAYLNELAQGLRLSDEVRAQIHRRVGAPPPP